MDKENGEKNETDVLMDISSESETAKETLNNIAVLENNLFATEKLLNIPLKKNAFLSTRIGRVHQVRISLFSVNSLKLNFNCFFSPVPHRNYM